MAGPGLDCGNRDERQRVCVQYTYSGGRAGNDNVCHCHSATLCSHVHLPSPSKSPKHKRDVESSKMSSTIVYLDYVLNLYFGYTGLNEMYCSN